MNNEYQSFLTKWDIRAQAAFGDAAAPAFATKVLARRMATRRDPGMVESFIRRYKIDYTQAERCSRSNSESSCAAKYPTLNEFFTRKIRGIRVDTDADIVSPATCKVVAFDTFPDSKIWIKGQRWSADRLLRARLNLNAFAVGVFRLRPADYHRFHAPFDAVVTGVRHVAGGYLSVDPVVVKSRNVFTENRRAIVELSSATFGTCYFVAVGAAGVGGVVISPRVGARVSAGEELGYFEFGGSTVVVLIPNPGGARVWRSELILASREGVETFVDVGRRVSSTAVLATVT